MMSDYHCPFGHITTLWVNRSFTSFVYNESAIVFQYDCVMNRQMKNGRNDEPAGFLI